MPGSSTGSAASAAEEELADIRPKLRYIPTHPYYQLWARESIPNLVRRYRPLPEL